MSLIQGFSLKDMFVGGKKTAKKHQKNTQRNLQKKVDIRKEKL